MVNTVPRMIARTTKKIIMAKMQMSLRRLRGCSMAGGIGTRDLILDLSLSDRSSTPVSFESASFSRIGDWLSVRVNALLGTKGRGTYILFRGGTFSTARGE